jgi:hypothetical protein
MHKLTIFQAIQLDAALARSAGARPQFELLTELLLHILENTLKVTGEIHPTEDRVKSLLEHRVRVISRKITSKQARIKYNTAPATDAVESAMEFIELNSQLDLCRYYLAPETLLRTIAAAPELASESQA